MSWCKGRVVMMAGSARPYARLVLRIARLLQDPSLIHDQWEVVAEFGPRRRTETCVIPDIVVDRAEALVGTTPRPLQLFLIELSLAV